MAFLRRSLVSDGGRHDLTRSCDFFRLVTPMEKTYEARTMTSKEDIMSLGNFMGHNLKHSLTERTESCMICECYCSCNFMGYRTQYEPCVHRAVKTEAAKNCEVRLLNRSNQRLLIKLAHDGSVC